MCCKGLTDWPLARRSHDPHSSRPCLPGICETNPQSECNLRTHTKLIGSESSLQLLEKFAGGARNVNAAGDAAFAVFYALDDAGGLATLRAIGAFGGVHHLLAVSGFCDLGAWCHG